jgi:hypothetical protein
MLAERVFVCGIALGVHNLKAFIEERTPITKLRRLGLTSSVHPLLSLGAGSWGLSTLGSVWSMNYGCGQEALSINHVCCQGPARSFDNFGNTSRAMQVLLCLA